MRMSIARCCCNTCPLTVTDWEDDFNLYADGEDLVSYGYFGSAAIDSSGPTEDSGEIKNQLSVGSSTAKATRAFNFPAKDLPAIYFEADQGTGNNTFFILGEYTASGLGFQITKEIGISIRSEELIVRYLDSNVLTTASYDITSAEGDTLSIDYQPTTVSGSSTSRTIEATVKFLRNGDVFATHTDSRTDSDAGFCAKYFGAYSNSATVTSDNWNFSINLSVAYPNPYSTGADPGFGFDWRFDSGQSASLIPSLGRDVEAGDSFSVETGSLPSGINLNGTTGEISGIAIGTGTGSVVIRLTTSAGTFRNSIEYEWESGLFTL